MPTTANLDPIAQAVDPGAPAVFTLTVLNDSLIVEAYTLTAVGAAAAWTTIEPAMLSIYPGTTETAIVTITPPRSAESVAGDVAVGIRVLPAEQPEGATVAEATLTIGRLSAASAEIVPRIARGRKRRRVRLAVDNGGNVPMIATITGASSDQLDIITRDPEISVDAGHAQFVDLVLTARKRIWRGAAINHPYGVVVVPDAGVPIELDGSFVQEPVFPRWFWKAVLALLALIALLVLLWFTLLKPAVESAAKNAVEEPVAEANERSDAAAQQAADATDAANEAKAALGQATTPPAPIPPSTITQTSTTIRLSTSALAGAEDESTRWVVPARSVLKITDIVINNPNGDFGQLTLENANVAQPLLTMGVENFRDLDLHFVTPIELGEADRLFINLECAEVGQPVGRAPLNSCVADALITGVVVTTN